MNWFKEKKKDNFKDKDDKKTILKLKKKFWFIFYLGVKVQPVEFDWVHPFEWAWPPKKYTHKMSLIY